MDTLIAVIVGSLIGIALVILGSTWLFSIPLLLSGYGLYRAGKYVAGMLQQYTIVKKEENVN